MPSRGLDEAPAAKCLNQSAGGVKTHVAMCQGGPPGITLREMSRPSTGVGGVTPACLAHKSVQAAL